MHEHPLKGQFDEKAAEWRRSTNLDGTPGKLEVGFAADGLVGLRTVDDPETILIYTPAEWDAFVAGAKDGEFDIEVLEEDARLAEEAEAAEKAAQDYAERAE